MTHADTAWKKFRGGYNCAQSVLYSYSETLDVDPDLALRIATGFGGGMGRKQEVCGAVTGGIMVLGLLHGRGENEGKERVDKTYLEVRNLIDSFTMVHGTLCCRDLLSGCSLLTEEGRKRFIEDGLVKRCLGYVRTVCDILDKQSFPA